MAGGVTVLREQAAAKVNLFLAVGPRRPDGYHELLTLYETVPLYDDVRVTIRPGASRWTYRVRATPPPSSPRLRLPVDLRNLAGRAAERFVAELEGTATPAGIEVFIAKRIPVAAGLGGGSSDAAAVLRALQAHFHDPLTANALSRAASELGSDVPLFLGGGRTIGRSRGEDLEPVAPGPGLPLVLGLPSFPLRTPDVYRRFDELRSASGGPDWPGAEQALGNLLRALSDSPEQLADIAAGLRNDLEPAAISLRPEVGELLLALRGAGCLGVIVSGSGPAVLGLAPSRDEAPTVRERARSLVPHGLRRKVSFISLVSGAR